MRSLLFLFISLFSAVASAQNLDDLFEEIKSSDNDSIIRIKAESAIELINQKERPNRLGEAYYYLGTSYEVSSPSKALDYFKKANQHLELERSDLVKNSYYKQSKLHTLFSEFPQAMETALKSLEFNKINGNAFEEQRDMSFIGYIHDRMYEFRESIKWNRRALKLAEKSKDSGAMALCYGRIGIAYDELAERANFNTKLFDSALYYNIKAAKLAELVGNLGFARTTYSNIGNSYSKLKDFEKAEEYTLKSLAVPGFESAKGVTLVNLGKIYLETGRYPEAKKYWIVPWLIPSNMVLANIN